MAIEFEGQDGSKIELSNSHLDKAVFGRASGIGTDDKSVSRRHVAFQLKPRAKHTGPRVSFEVLGKNPVWVRRNEDDEVRVFRRSEKGDLSEGDRFCLSAKGPTWFALRRIGDEDGEARISDQEDDIGGELGPSPGIVSELEGFDASDIDPVKEFGFIVMGHEFDRYPKHMILDPKQWDWFLEDNSKESSDEEEEEEEEEDHGKKKKKKKRGERKKRKKGKEDNDDEDWTGESEDDEVVIGTIRKASRPKYSTRSKDRGKQPDKDAQKSMKSTQKKVYNADEDEGDEEDETLGGFIVGDEDAELEDEAINEEDDEEEEFDDDEDEDLVDV